MLIYNCYEKLSNGYLCWIKYKKYEEDEEIGNNIEITIDELVNKWKRT